MKIILIAFLLAFHSHAAKTYELKVIVHALGTNEPIEGLQVNLSIKDKTIASGLTDANGAVVFAGLRTKNLKIDFTDSSGTYNCHKHLTVNNRKREDVIKKTYLRWNPELEDQMFTEREQTNKESLDKEKDKKKEERPPCETEDSDDWAMYPNGAGAMQRFLMDNLLYPEESIEMGDQGKVYLSFIIEKNGEISNIKVERGISKALDREAKMLIFYMPKWHPGKRCGEPVRTRIKVPIIFALN